MTPVAAEFHYSGRCECDSCDELRREHDEDCNAFWGDPCDCGNAACEATQPGYKRGLGGEVRSPDDDRYEEFEPHGEGGQDDGNS